VKTPDGLSPGQGGVAVPPRTAHVFLAPHYDDVALSCGGTVAALADAGLRPLVVTVFGGDPAPENLTAFARFQHDRWGTGEGDTIATRLAEDRAAAAALGCATRVFPFLDAIYRGDHYLSDEALFGDLADDDGPLVEQLVAEVAALPELADLTDATLYVPLAIGNHVDHQIVFQVGQRLATRGLRVLAYEDFPYVALPDQASRRLAAVAGAIEPPVLVPVAGTLTRRVAAIAAYRSQVPTIFRFTDDWRGVVEGWARALGGDVGPAERYWPLTVLS
jgi:LmbE family N-acetylglucosaminyl deacetylase